MNNKQIKQTTKQILQSACACGAQRFRFDGRVKGGISEWGGLPLEECGCKYQRIAQLIETLSNDDTDIATAFKILEGK